MCCDEVDLNKPRTKCLSTTSQGGYLHPSLRPRSVSVVLMHIFEHFGQANKALAQGPLTLRWTRYPSLAGAGVGATGRCPLHIRACWDTAAGSRRKSWKWPLLQELETAVLPLSSGLWLKQLSRCSKMVASINYFAGLAVHGRCSVPPPTPDRRRLPTAPLALQLTALAPVCRRRRPALKTRQTAWRASGGSRGPTCCGTM